MYRHVHFGAGALGLGLMCAGGRETRCDRFILNRDSDGSRERLLSLSREGGYDLIPYGGRRKFIPITGAMSYDDVDFIGLADTERPMLITTALKKRGLDESFRQLAELISARGDRPTFIVAGENQVDSHYLADKLYPENQKKPKNTVFVRSVVDRICNKPTMKYGRVSVYCEKFGAVYLENLKPRIPVQLVPNRVRWKTVAGYEYVVDRKKWIVNAVHLTISLIAHYEGFSSVRELISSDTRKEALLKGVISECRNLFLKVYADKQAALGESEAELDSFCNDLFVRIRDYPQRIYDAVTRFTGPERLQEFIDDFHRKVSDPSLRVMKSSSTNAPYYPSLAAAIVCELVKQDKWIKPV